MPAAPAPHRVRLGFAAVLPGLLLALPVAALAFSIEGTVYEDANYGGDAGRSLAASSGSPRPGARAELYDGTGVFLSFTTTDGSGEYSFGGLSAGSYTVRIVNSSVTSSRSGYTSSLRAVQTYRTDGSSGSAVAVTDHVGGEVPSKVDAGNGSTTLAALTNSTTTAQSIAPVTLTAADVSDIDFGFSFNVMVNVNPTGHGSLDQVLQNTEALSASGLAQAGRTAGIDHVIFMLADGTARPGLTASYTSLFSGGVATIDVASGGLTWVDNPLVLDAETQPGFSGQPMIELDGSATSGSTNGIQFRADDSIIRGFITHSFADEGIEILGDNNVIQNNWVGIDASGNAAPNGDNGTVVAAGAAGNLFGGPSPSDGNVMSGNTSSGIFFRDSGVDSNVVQNNLFGVGPDGTTPVPNGLHGVHISTTVTTTTVGGTAPGLANTIAHNTDAGVAVSGAGAGNAIQGNVIRSNGGLGIDIGSSGVTANDGLKTGGQPNLLMDHPVITGAVVNGDSLTVTGYVGSAPGQAAFAGSRVEIYRSDGDGSGYGEGPTYLGFLTTDGSDGDFGGTLTGTGIVGGDEITGTATDGSGNTSEFGANATATEILKVVKRAYLADGTAIPHGAVVPTGTEVKFLLYVNNPGAAITDVSLQDVLDSGFQYVASTMRFSNALGPCAAGGCTPAEEDAIFLDADSGTPGTDALDGDIVSRSGATLSVGNETAANGQLDLAAAKVWAAVFTVRVQ